MQHLLPFLNYVPPGPSGDQLAELITDNLLLLSNFLHRVATDVLLPRFVDPPHRMIRSTSPWRTQWMQKCAECCQSVFTDPAWQGEIMPRAIVQCSNRTDLGM